MARTLSVLMGGVLLVCSGCPLTEQTGEFEVSRFYGLLRTDFVQNSAETVNDGNWGDYVWYVNNTALKGRTVITPRASLVGFDFNWGQGIEGKLEMDFYGEDGWGDVQFEPRVRCLYAKLDLGGGTSLLAGIADDVFSPLSPDTVSYSPGWNCGNTGYRRPLFCLGYEKGGFKAQAAAARSEFENSGMPDLQIRAAYEKTADNGKPKITTGISGLAGHADQDEDDVGESAEGVALDFQFALGSRVTLSAEFFQGQNMYPYFGGIYEWTYFDIGQDVRTTGGWLQLGIKLTEKVAMNIVYLIDDPDIPTGAAAVPERNECILLNVMFDVNDKTRTGIELSSRETVWEIDGAFDSTAVQISLQIAF